MAGNLQKMRVENTKPVEYFLTLDEQEIKMNDLIGKKISFEFTGEINCIKCGRKINKTFNQGFCYHCFISAPEADPAIIKPELDMAHKGIWRNEEWAKTHSLIDHFVYLSYSSNLKVGVTRYNQIPTRWIDQGAVKAIILAKTPYRNLAGQIEVTLKEHFKDKTNWRKMLKNIEEISVDLVTEKQKAISLLPDNLKQYAYDDNTVCELFYPVEKYPEQVKSINLYTTPVFEKILTGIKAQYLIFDDNYVINIRKYGGYRINLKIISNI